MECTPVMQTQKKDQPPKLSKFQVENSAFHFFGTYSLTKETWSKTNTKVSVLPHIKLLKLASIELSILNVLFFFKVKRLVLIEEWSSILLISKILFKS